jgi:hypothetical protein
MVGIKNGLSESNKGLASKHAENPSVHASLVDG